MTLLTELPDYFEQLCQADAGVVLAPCEDHSALFVEGPDSPAFLHSLLTADIQALQINDACLGAFCSGKGRVIALLSIKRCAETKFLLICPTNVQELLTTKLQMFIFRSKVTLTPAPSWKGLRIYGSALKSSPDELNIAHRRELWAEETQLAEFISASRASATLYRAPALWIRAQDAKANYPHFSAALCEQFVPQMLNLDLLDAVSWNKGCYPGQEIIARTKFLGRQKRRLLSLRCDNAATLPGALEEISQNARGVGKVIDAANHGQQGWMSAVLQLDLIDSTPFTDSYGQVWTLNEAPYPIPEFDI